MKKGLVKKFMTDANEQKVIDVQSFIKLNTLEAICETSVRIDNATEKNAVDFIESMVKLGYHIHYRANASWFWLHYTYTFSSTRKDFYHSLNSLHNFAANPINKHILIQVYKGSMIMIFFSINM